MSQRCRVSFILKVFEEERQIDALVYDRENNIIDNSYPIVFGPPPKNIGVGYYLIAFQAIVFQPESKNFHFQFEIQQILIDFLPPQIRSTPLLIMKSKSVLLPSAPPSPIDPQQIEVTDAYDDEFEKRLLDIDDTVNMDSIVADQNILEDKDVDTKEEKEVCFIDDNVDDDIERKQLQEMANEMTTIEEMDEINVPHVDNDINVDNLNALLSDFDSFELGVDVDTLEDYCEERNEAVVCEVEINEHMEYRNAAVLPIIQKLGIKNSLMLFEFNPLR